MAVPSLPEVKNFVQIVRRQDHGANKSMQDAKSILVVLDKAAQDFSFPMLDNGYLYLAASRLSLFRSVEKWALVFEIFGFSPREGDPSLSVSTISSHLYNGNSAADYVSEDAYQTYLAKNPNTEARYFYPISNRDWIDEEDPELVASEGTLTLRGKSLGLPARAEFGAEGIALEGDRPAVFELCRFLASRYHDETLASGMERRVSVSPEMNQFLLLDNWHHPDLVRGQMPSQTKTFQELARALEDGNPRTFTSPETPNNHWINWPDGGTL
jgi:hypothetical protein